ncbi:MAG: hypothetical protein RLZZ127_67 [Planctomycetota bacterium]|jgi:hypothetical protein
MEPGRMLIRSGRCNGVGVGWVVGSGVGLGLGVD